MDRVVPKTIASSSPQAQISSGEAAALSQRVEDNAFHLPVARQRLADEVPDKATNDDVLA